MPVAKSYQSLKMVGEPYVKNGKKYIMVEKSNGLQKEVRYYSNEEYNKMYPDDQIKSRFTSPYYKPQKYTLGFEKGYITIFRNTLEEHEEWFKQSICRFAKWWGWYVISTEEVPQDLPSGVEPVRLDWAPIGNDEDNLADEATVQAHVMATLYPKTAISKRQGSVGKRLERDIKIKEVQSMETQYGTTRTFIMEDKDKNIYLWRTSARNWVNGSERKIRGTVKEYTEYKGQQTTVLTRCMECN